MAIEIYLLTHVARARVRTFYTRAKPIAVFQ